jgi:transcriptional regulator with XRE-family HTH domain
MSVPTVSSNIVRYLQESEHMTLREIGELMGLKESFISRVRKGERSFTLQRLQKLEASLGKPLTMILIEATPVELAPTKLKPLYAAFRGFLATLEQNGEISDAQMA